MFCLYNKTSNETDRQGCLTYHLFWLWNFSYNYLRIFQALNRSVGDGGWAIKCIVTVYLNTHMLAIVIMSLTTGGDTSAHVPSEVAKVDFDSEQIPSCYEHGGVKITLVTAPRCRTAFVHLEQCFSFQYQPQWRLLSLPLQRVDFLQRNQHVQKKAKGQLIFR